MPRYVQLVMGPAGSGKSTYCSTLVKHAEEMGRSIQVINLDPAAEHFDYPVYADIRDLIQLDDAMEDDSLRFGPNGGLVFCMEYFAQNMDWLQEAIDEVEDDYILFDCPGQIELYTHIPVMEQFADQLVQWDFRVCSVFILDAQFMIEASKFISGVMCALSTMVTLEMTHVNVMSKLDLLNKKARKDLERFLEPNLQSLLLDELDGDRMGKRFGKLSAAIAGMIDDYSLVKFLPMDITDEESINDVLIQIDMAIQYGEDLDVQTKDFDDGGGEKEDPLDFLDMNQT